MMYEVKGPNPDTVKMSSQNTKVETDVMVEIKDAENITIEEKSPETNQFEEIVSFLTKNKESRDEALDIILAFTTTMVNRKKFKNTDVVKTLLRLTSECIEDEPVTSKSFQCLINFSLDKTWVEKLVEINVSRRVFEYLMHNVKPSSGSIRTTNAQIIKVK